MAEVIVNNAEQNENTGMRNEVELVGHMVSRNETQGCLTAHFRASTMRGNRKYTNTMTLLTFAPEVKTKVNSFQLREKVRVKGYVSSSRRRAEEEQGNTAANAFNPSQGTQAAGTAPQAGQTAQAGQAVQAVQQPKDLEDFDQIFVVSDIEKADSHAADENKISVEGVVVRSRVTRRGSVVFLIRTMRKDGSNMGCLVKAAASPQINPDMLSLMPSGTRVAFDGHCSAHSVNREGRIEYRESVVIDSIRRA